MTSTATALTSTTDSPLSSTTSQSFIDNPSATPETTQSSGGFGNSSTPLYLFTFLATLFVLLFVSCAIVLRSFYLRRQMRRRYEEAIAAGLLPSSAFPGARRRDFGEKPKLYDAALNPAAGEKWNYIVPVSANVLKIPQANALPEPGPTMPTRLDFLKESFRSFVPSSLRRRQSQNLANSSQHSDPSPFPNDTQDALANTSNVQVSVLIAMPHPHGTRDSFSLKGKGRGDSGYWDDDERNVPDVVIGVSQVKLRTDQQ